MQMQNQIFHIQSVVKRTERIDINESVRFLTHFQLNYKPGKK